MYDALWSVDFAESRVVRGLLELRALPATVLEAFRRLAAAAAWRSRPVDGEDARSRPWSRGARDRRRSLTLRDIVESGFVLLAAEPPRELVLGVVGAFWRLTGDVRRHVDPEGFRGPQTAGTARAAWNFLVVERADGRSVLSTETRVHCADAASRRRFRVYWLVIRPGSGLIRRAMLRSIRRAAER